MEGDQRCDRCAIWKRQNYYWIRTRRAKKSFNIDSCPPQTAIGPVGRTNSDIPGIPKAHIGQYSGAKKDIGKQITVGLLQSFARMKDLSAIKNQFGMVLVDECHHIPASTFREVVAQLNPQFLYGLTATPKRKHNDEKLIYIYIGENPCTNGCDT